KQIHATVDGKTVVTSESTVRNDLHFNDEDVIGTDGYAYPAYDLVSFAINGIVASCVSPTGGCDTRFIMSMNTAGAFV
nr:hypothetical protein [Tanacetum cinerariifolium]